MKTMRMFVIAAVVALGLFACGDDADPPDETLYERLGGEAGIEAVVEDFLARVDGDEKINGYFRNTSVDGGRLERCLVKQIGNATGGPQAYPDPAAGCRSMAEAHAGLGISTVDFNDLVAHLVDALEDAGVAAADIETITGVLDGVRGDVVEDVDSNATVYQRVGRKAAIATVVTDFEALVVADDRVNGFFAGVTDITRLHQCLTRQICAIDGPCKYGEEVDAEFAPLTGQFPCRAMGPSHFGLQDTAGSPILIEDFNAIAENQVLALTAAGVAPADIDAIVGALGALCPEIVANGTGCP